METFVRNSNDDIYERNVKRGFRYGHIVLDNGIELYHASPDEIDKSLTDSGFVKVDGKDEKYKTWSDEMVDGYTCVFRKNR
ncbi:MAG: hypothetical protein GX567_08515 [Clostridia bacterium]|nr:hypothetical protein [Clostridia bacterium]